MRRCLIIIGNEGNLGNFLSGVRPDIDRYLAFFKSDFGGAWEDTEIETLHYGWTRAELCNTLVRRTNDGLDYALIVFAGHGYAERNKDVYFELSPNQEVSLSDIESWLPYQKMLMIADSCQVYLDEPLLKTLTESIRTFSAGGRMANSRAVNRARYDKRIVSMDRNSKAFVSAVSPGEYAQDTSKGGLYSRTLMDIAENLIEQLNGAGRDCMIKDIHDLASKEVAKKSGGRQHPSLNLYGGTEYPPFLIL